MKLGLITAVVVSLSLYAPSAAAVAPVVRVVAMGGGAALGAAGGLLGGSGICAELLGGEPLECIVGIGQVGAIVGGIFGLVIVKRLLPSQPSSEAEAFESESSAPQLSVSPYIHSEGSGLMFSGRF